MSGLTSPFTKGRECSCRTIVFVFVGEGGMLVTYRLKLPLTCTLPARHDRRARHVKEAMRRVISERGFFQRTI